MSTEARPLVGETPRIDSQTRDGHENGASGRDLGLAGLFQEMRLDDGIKEYFQSSDGLPQKSDLTPFSIYSFGLAMEQARSFNPLRNPHEGKAEDLISVQERVIGRWIELSISKQRKGRGEYVDTMKAKMARTLFRRIHREEESL